MTDEMINEQKARQHKQMVQNTEEVVNQKNKRGGQFKSVKNLGSAANYTEEADAYKKQAPDKVAYYDRKG